MKIIKKGNLPQEKIYRTTCSNCKTEFDFKYKEAEYVSDQRDGNYLKIKCPLEGCNHTCHVNPKW